MGKPWKSHQSNLSPQMQHGNTWMMEATKVTNGQKKYLMTANGMKVPENLVMEEMAKLQNFLAVQTNDKVRTYYFRHKFNIDDLSKTPFVVADIVRDDGVIVYLNGKKLLEITCLAEKSIIKLFCSNRVGKQKQRH